MAALRTKNVYDKKGDEDGLRVLVMRFWPRGKRKDSVDLWIRELGPSPALIKRWKAGEISWEGFRKAYLSERQGDAGQSALCELKSLLKTNNTVTVLCGCKDEEHCHRTILKRMLVAPPGKGLKKRNPRGR